jgi:small GTP-binding protein
VEGVFDDRYLSTIGVKITRKVLDLNGETVHFFIWDLAGGEQYAKYQASYLSGARGAVIVADLTRPSTLEHLPDYASQVKMISPAADVMFVGNKLDLVNGQELSKDYLEPLSALSKGETILTSAKTGRQVEDIFMKLARSIREKS